MPTDLFLYGTLMRGESRHRYLAGQEFVGAAETAPEYRLYDVGDYPALIPAQGGVSVTGELWRVSDETLRELDDVEGVEDGLYVRQTVQLRPPHEALRVQTYIYRQDIRGLREIGVCWRDQ